MNADLQTWIPRLVRILSAALVDVRSNREHPKSGDVPGCFYHSNQLLIIFWTCLIYSMHILKKSPQVQLKVIVYIGRRKRPRLAD